MSGKFSVSGITLVGRIIAPSRGCLYRKENYMKRPVGKCWEDTVNKLDNDGYSCRTINYKLIGGHRISYEFFIGSIKPGMEIDHVCGIRNCYNPAHLEQVTKSENARRAGYLYHCANGHVKRASGIVRKPKGYYCRSCKALIVRVTSLHGFDIPRDRWSRKNGL